MDASFVFVRRKKWLGLVAGIAALMLFFAAPVLAQTASARAWSPGTPLAMPPDPPADIPGMEPFIEVTTIQGIQDAFNAARTSENTDAVPADYEPMPMMNLTGSFTQAAWDALTPGQQGLWLLNSERAARGIPQFEGINADLEAVMQGWTDHLLAVGPPYGHGDPIARVEANPNLAGCYQAFAENLAYYSPINAPLLYPVAEAIYDWTYEDVMSSWGHRHNDLTDGYFDNNGATGQEGLLGFAVSIGVNNNGFPIVIIGVDFYDPRRTCPQLAPPAPSAIHADYGDQPGYGAVWHTGTDLRLGATKTLESTTPATDTGDDGISFGAFNAGQTAIITANIQGDGGNVYWLRLWFDWDGNGVFDDVSELAADQSVVNGNNAITVAVPSGITAGVKYRARLYDSATAPTGTGEAIHSAYGGAAGGEVEDGASPAPLAVLLADFSAVQQGQAVVVTWETTTEQNNRGFNLYRGVTPDVWDQRLNGALIPSQVQGSLGGFLYRWNDQQDLVQGDSYWYWLEDVDVNGTATMHGPVSLTYQAPTAVQLAGMKAATASLDLYSLLLLVVLGLAALAMPLRRRLSGV